MDSSQSELNYGIALEQLRSEACRSADRLKAGTFIILGQYYDDYPEVVLVLEKLSDQYSNHPLWNLCMGYAKVTQQLPVPAISHLLKALGHINNNQLVYRALTWAYLLTDSFAEAYLASSAGLNHFPEDGHLNGLKGLSKLCAQGTRTVKFISDDVNYEFFLFTSNTQELEASLHHLSHQFTEKEELKMIRDHVGKVSSVAEIGCLVGNHSVFFLKNLSPKRMTIIDASSTSLAHAKINLDLNQDIQNPVDIDFVHSAVGDKEYTLSFFNESVTVKPIDNLLKEPFDFIKIDVDSMEMEALEGASNYMKTHHPKIMIEVLHQLKKPFEEYLEKVDYTIIAQHDRSQYSNYLIGFSGQPIVSL